MHCPRCCKTGETHLHQPSANRESLSEPDVQPTEGDGAQSHASPHPLILIVDDEEILRTILKYMLEENGCRVAESQSGNEAWCQLCQRNIDLVISDIRMPDGDGLELLDRIQKRPHHPDVILITAYADITEAEARARGAAAVFNKPFDYGTFLRKVDDVLHGHP